VETSLPWPIRIFPLVAVTTRFFVASAGVANAQKKNLLSKLNRILKHFPATLLTIENPKIEHDCV